MPTSKFNDESNQIDVLKRLKTKARKRRRTDSQEYERICSLVQVIFRNGPTITFKFVDVPPDGHCMFHSVIKALKLCISQHELRKKIIDFVVNGKLNGKPYSNAIPVKQFVEDVRETLIAKWAKDMDNNDKKHVAPKASWGSTCELAFASLMCNVHITTISNFNSGANHAHIENIMSMFKGLMPPGCKTIYLYNHVAGSPFKHAHHGKFDHYGALVPMEMYLQESKLHIITDVDPCVNDVPKEVPEMTIKKEKEVLEKITKKEKDVKMKKSNKINELKKNLKTMHRVRETKLTGSKEYETICGEIYQELQKFDSLVGLAGLSDFQKECLRDAKSAI